MIYGIGIDAVDIARFKSIVERRGDKFLKRLFTPAELGYCMNKKRPEAHLSARFAAKASVLKALGSASMGGFSMIEIRRDSLGRPRASGSILEGLKVNISLAHEKGLAIAEAIVEKD